MNYQEFTLDSNSDNIQRNIRVFISSTFRDMEEERNLLMTHAWPQLRSFCRERNVEFVEVDLRWGISEEESTQYNTLKICLDEINACRPFFIGLVGERYGWVPPADVYHDFLLEEYEWLRDLRDKSVTELEVMNGVINQPEKAGHSFFYFRDPVYAHERGPEFLSENEDLAKKHSAFKDNIRKCCHNNQIPLREDYANPAELVSWILEDLKSAIELKYPIAEVQNAMSRDAQDHEAFAASRRKIYIHRQSNYDVLDQHALASDVPLVITGEAGSGKSALLANWIHHWRTKHPEDYIFQHYVGATADSSDYLKLMTRLMAEIKNWCNDLGDLPKNKDDILRDFDSWLVRARLKAERDDVRLILVLNSLNQLDGNLVFWLPEHPFTGNLRLLVSTNNGVTHDALSRRNWKMYPLGLLNAEEKCQMIVEYLLHFGKKLDRMRISQIVQCIPSSNPLFIKLLLDELKATASHELLDELLKKYLSAKSIPELIQLIVIRYQKDYDVNRKDLVKDTLSLICAARRGLSESELLQLLKPEGLQKLPQATWAPFRAVLEEQLISRSGIWNFTHDYIRQVVARLFLFDQDHLNEYRIRLADYFEVEVPNERNCDELPWLLHKSKLHSKLRSCILNPLHFCFIFEKNSYELYKYWEDIGEYHKLDFNYIRVLRDYIKNTNKIPIDFIRRLRYFVTDKYVEVELLICLVEIDEAFGLDKGILAIDLVELSNELLTYNFINPNKINLWIAIEQKLNNKTSGNNINIDKYLDLSFRLKRKDLTRLAELELYLSLVDSGQYKNDYIFSENFFKVDILNKINQSRICESEKLIRRAVMIIIEKYGPNSEEYLIINEKWIDFLLKIGRIDEAMELTEFQIRQSELQLGYMHQATGQLIAKIAHKFYLIGNLTKSKNLYLKALEIYEKNFGAEDSKTTRLRMDLRRIMN